MVLQCGLVGRKIFSTCDDAKLDPAWPYARSEEIFLELVLASTLNIFRTPRPHTNSALFMERV